MKAAKGSGRVKRAGEAWTHERIVRALELLERRKEGLGLQALAAELGVLPRQIVELTHWVLGPDPVLGLQGNEYTPIFSLGPDGMRVLAGTGVARVLKRLAVIGSNEVGLALAGLRRLQAQGPPARRAVLAALADRLARTDAIAEARGADQSLAQPLPLLDLQARIEAAIAGKKRLRFLYRGAKGFQERRVRPRCVFVGPVEGEPLYLEAWDEGARPGPRHFRLAQILRDSLRAEGVASAFTPAEEDAFAQGRMDSPFEQAFEPALVLARGRAAKELAQGAFRATAWNGAKVRPPAGWKAFTLRYHEPEALVAVLRAWVPDVRVAGPPAFERAWKAEVAAMKKAYL